MYNFEYANPSTVDEAAAALAAGGQALAGGQTLLATMKQRLAAPETLIDLGKISGLSGVKKDGNTLVVGAMTRHMDVANNDLVKANIPALAALAGQIGDRQVRARGTLGGSVANNDPAACYPSAVLALNATVHTNKRTVAADDFFQGMYTTALEEGELITAIAFEIPKRAAYVKFKQPASRFAMVGVFAAELASGPRVAVTGAASCVYRQADMEKALAGNFSAAALDGVSVSANGLNADLHASAAYRAQLVKVVAQRAVTAAG
jgi:aerobic carbon-monoxide dehydrogenase medium subunit